MSTPKFITLTGLNDKPVRFNVAQIVTIDVGVNGDTPATCVATTALCDDSSDVWVRETPEEIDALISAQQPDTLSDLVGRFYGWSVTPHAPDNRAALDALAARGRDLAMAGHLDEALEVAEQIDRIAGQQPQPDALVSELVEAGAAFYSAVQRAEDEGELPEGFTERFGSRFSAVLSKVPAATGKE